MSTLDWMNVKDDSLWEVKWKKPKLGWLFGSGSIQRNGRKLWRLQKAPALLLVVLDSFILKKVNSVEIVFYFLNKLVNVTNEKKILLLSVKEPLTCQAYQNCKIFPQELLNYIWSFVFEIIFRKDSINEFFFWFSLASRIVG